MLTIIVRQWCLKYKYKYVDDSGHLKEGASLCGRHAVPTLERLEIGESNLFDFSPLCVLRHAVPTLDRRAYLIFVTDTRTVSVEKFQISVHETCGES